MTRTRALLGALAAGSLSFGLATSASAQIINDITGTVSQADFACLGLLMVVGQPSCTFNAIGFDDASFPGTGDGGPVQLAGHYLDGDSPWQVAGAPSATGGVPGDGKSAIAISGTVTIDDLGTPCDADDTLAADISYGAAVRAFAGGQTSTGEESWGDGDLSFSLAATTVDSATANGGGGCDYVIGDAGAPPLLTSDSGAVYGDDIDPAVDLWTPNDGSDYSGNTPTLSTFESDPNGGAAMTVVNGVSYVCEFFDAAVGPCAAGGAHHEVATAGDRATIENSIWVVSTDGGGNITNAQAYPVSELAQATFNQPQWSSPLWTFTGTAQGGGATAVDDPGQGTLQDTPVDIDVLANDTGFTDPVTVSIDTQGASGVASINGVNPGTQDQITITYTPNAGTSGQDTFIYQVDDGASTDTATVTIDVQPDSTPVANADTAPDIDTTGAAPESQTSAIDVAAITGNELGNAPSTVTATDGATGTTSVTGTTVTYTPNADFFVGSDTFDYTITDAQSDEATATITVNLTDTQPAAGDGTAQTTPDTAVDINLNVTPGNGEVTDHIIAANDGANGTVTVAGAVATYTPDTGFEGDDSFTYTVEDANGDVSAAGTVTVTVAEAPTGGGGGGVPVSLPGGKSALGLGSLALLMGLPLLRRRRQR